MEGSSITSDKPYRYNVTDVEVTGADVLTEES